MNILRPGQAERDRLGTNESTWLVNIGTHKLPDSDEEFVILRESLTNALERVLSSEQIVQCFFIFDKSADGRINQNIRRMEFRTFNSLGIPRGEMVATFQVERGTKTGRIDAHIIMKVPHRNKIQFDNNRFQELLDQELLVENRRFAAAGMFTKFPDKPLKWADPKLYVSFRLLGRTLLQNALNYIDKQQQQQITEAERLAVEVLGSGFR